MTSFDGVNGPSVSALGCRCRALVLQPGARSCQLRDARLSARAAELAVIPDWRDVRSCRMLSLDRLMADLPVAAHTRGMAALDASLAPSRELGLATVAHLSRYRGTSREHTESDLRVFFGWCQDRQLAPLDAQRNDL